MLAAAARSLPAPERFRLWSIEIDGHIISSHLFIAAGGVVSYWLGGFDEAWAAQHPSMQTLLIAMEHAWSVGDRVFDLGQGGGAYKYRLADEEDTLEWLVVIPRGKGHLSSRLRWMPMQLARSVKRSLPAGIREDLAAARSRLPRMRSLVHVGSRAPKE
jgi:CelD/BcsL family acetyltransferase involved in cellulose biosynthesis